MLLSSIYLGFLKIGAFAFGGGYAMIPYMQQVIVNQNHWVTNAQFSSYFGLVQIASGPVTVNLSTYIGFKLDGIMGALMAVLGIATIPFILVSIACVVFEKLKNSKTWKDALKGMKPALIGLILSAAVSVSSVYTTNWRELAIAAVTAILIFYKKMQALPIIVICAALGVILYLF